MVQYSSVDIAVWNIMESIIGKTRQCFPYAIIWNTADVMSFISNWLVGRYHLVLMYRLCTNKHVFFLAARLTSNQNR